MSIYRRILFQQYQHPDSDLSILLAAFFFCASSPFVYCFFGIMTTESYIQMADSLFESNWQRLSIDLQKYFILMLGNMHRPLYYHGFGIVILNLETFRNVRKWSKIWSQIKLSCLLLCWRLQIFRSIITYYMMFKALTLEWNVSLNSNGNCKESIIVYFIRLATK